MTTVDEAMRAGMQELARRGDPLVVGAFGWCAKCGGVRPVQGSVLVPIRETVPHYQYRFVWFAACPERHAMAALCDGCGKAPTREGYDYCVTCWPDDADEPLQHRVAAAEAAHDFKRDLVAETKPLVRP